MSPPSISISPPFHNLQLVAEVAAAAVEYGTMNCLSSMDETGDGVYCKSPLDRKVYMLQKIYGIVEVSNSQQTFTARMGCETYVHMTREEHEMFKAKPREFDPEFDVDVFAYNGLSITYEPDMLTVDRCMYIIKNIDGCICYGRQRMYTATFSESMELQAFPFDVQKLTMAFVVHFYANNGAKFTLIPFLNGCQFSTNFVDPHGEFSVLKDKLQSVIERSRMTCIVPIRRNFEFYIYRVILTMCILDLVSICSFLIDDYSNQLSLISTILLTVVAFLFILTQYLPVISYLTLLDKFVYCSLAYIFLIILQTTANSMNADEQNVSSIDLAFIYLIVWFAGMSFFVYFSWYSYCREEKKLDEKVEMNSITVSTSNHAAK